MIHSTADFLNVWPENASHLGSFHITILSVFIPTVLENLPHDPIIKKDLKWCCISFRLLTLKLSGLYCSSMFTTVVQWLPLSDPSNKYQTTTLSGMACTGSEFKLPNLTHYSFSHKTHTVDISTLFCYLTYLNG